MHRSTRRDSQFRHGSASRGSDPNAMATEPTQRSGQRRVRTPSPNRRPDRNRLVNADWQEQIDGLQQQIGTLVRNLASHAQHIAKLDVAMESGISAVHAKIDSHVTHTDNRFLTGGDKVQQQMNKLIEKVQSQLDRMQLELRAFAHGARSDEQQPEPAPGIDVPSYYNMSPGNVGVSGNQFDSTNLTTTVPSGDCNGTDNPFACPRSVQEAEARMNGAPATSTTHQPPPQQMPHARQHDFGCNNHPYYGASHPHNVQFAPPRQNSGQQPTYLPQQCPHTTAHTTHTTYFAGGFKQPSAPLWNSYNNDDFKLERKGVSDLPMFDGKHDKYSHWKNKLTDHAAENNTYWRAILKHVQQCTTPIDFHVLAATKYGKSTGWDLAMDLWNLISKRIGITLYEKRIQMANGVEGNGFELWRRYFFEYEGNDEYIQLEGRTKLQTYAPIHDTSGLLDKLDDWQHQLLKYGGDIGPLTRYTMLLKILPNSVRQDVIKNCAKDVDHIIAYIRNTSVWDRAEELRRKRNGAVTAISGGSWDQVDTPATEGASRTTGAKPDQTLIEAVVAAVKKKTNGPRRGAPNTRSGSPRSTSPKNNARSTFPKGNCYHCNKPGHGRTAKGDRPGCPEFVKLLERNGGKLPEGYKGAFEKHVEAFKKKNNKSVGALNDEDLLKWLKEDDSEDDSDDDSDDGILRPCGAVWKTHPPRRTLALPNVDRSSANDVALHNPFEALADEDMEEPIADLTSWAHKVTTATSKKGKSKSWKIETDEDLENLGNLLCSANKRPSAKALRRIKEDDLDSLARLVERKSSTPDSVKKASRKVWAMVDSGSFVTIANCGNAFLGHEVNPSHGSMNGIKYSDASGGDIPNRGEVVVTHRLDDGTEIDIPFQDGDVQVPIISVKDFVHKGSVVKFKRNGGTIRLPSGTRMQFMEKCGVYFICLNVTSGTFNNNTATTTNDTNVVATVNDTPPPPPPTPSCGDTCQCRPRRRKSTFSRPVP